MDSSRLEYLMDELSIEAFDSIGIATVYPGVWDLIGGWIVWFHR